MAKFLSGTLDLQLPLVVSILLSTLLVFELLAIPVDSLSAIYDYTAVPEPGETFGTTLFRIYIPDDEPEIRGVYFRVSPHLSDSRPYTTDRDFQALSDSVAFGFMGALLDDLDMGTGVGNALLRALAYFAQASTHPELEHTTIFFEGYSWGGQFSYHFTKWLPARVLGFVTMKGGYHDTSPAGDAIVVPGYLFIGEFDLPYRIENLTSIFESHRPLGARWILAVQPGAGHEYVDERELLDEYFHTVIMLRLPEVIPPDEPPELFTIPEPESWLGDRSSFLIGSWDCYDASPDSACWFPSRKVGFSWQGFVSADSVTDTIPCPTGVTPGPDPSSTVVRVFQNYPNPFNPVTTIDFDLLVPRKVELTVYTVNGRFVKTLLDEQLMPGHFTVNWNGQNELGRPVSSGIYLLSLTAGNFGTTKRMLLTR
jgi:hypothetical protein